MGTDFPAGSAGVKKSPSLCSLQGMALVGMGQGSGVRGFFHGRRSRGRFLLMKYGGGRFTPAAFLLIKSHSRIQFFFFKK